MINICSAHHSSGSLLCDDGFLHLHSVDDVDVDEHDEPVSSSTALRSRSNSRAVITPDPKQSSAWWDGGGWWWLIAQQQNKCWNKTFICETMVMFQMRISSPQAHLSISLGGREGCILFMYIVHYIYYTKVALHTRAHPAVCASMGIEAPPCATWVAGQRGMRPNTSHCWRASRHRPIHDPWSKVMMMMILIMMTMVIS